MVSAYFADGWRLILSAKVSLISLLLELSATSRSSYIGRPQCSQTEESLSYGREMPESRKSVANRAGVGKNRCSCQRVVSGTSSSDAAPRHTAESVSRETLLILRDSTETTVFHMKHLASEEYLLIDSHRLGEFGWGRLSPSPTRRVELARPPLPSISVPHSPPRNTPPFSSTATLKETPLLPSVSRRTPPGAPSTKHLF